MRKSHYACSSSLALLLFICFSAPLPLGAQSFPDIVVGTWEGKMFIQRDGAVKDSVAIRLTIAKGSVPGTWPWKTEYLSPTLPMTKDYVLRLTDASKQTYGMDEGGGIMLVEQRFGNKLYCVFETHDVMLTSTYEWLGDRLIFEVTSGKKLSRGTEVINYSVTNLQRAVLKRVP